MIPTTVFHPDYLIWVLVASASVLGALAHWRPGDLIEAVAPGPGQPAPIESNPLPVPTQRIGIPSTALAKIHEACGGLIKDGELDMHFDLRSRQDCDKMLRLMGRIKGNLQHTKSVFNQSEAEIRAQLDGPLAAAGTSTSRLVGIFGRDAANVKKLAAIKLAELHGFETATRLVDKFILELVGAEVSIRKLPFYADPDPAPARE